jgi:SAM-dependent methyltransferase
MYALESTYWWFQGRRRVILSLIDRHVPHVARTPGGPRPRILDIGCGTGMLLGDLQEMGDAVGLDFAPVAIEYCRSRNLKNLARANVRQLPVLDNSVDLVTALDLIEHVPDDAGLLSEIHRVLRPGGFAVMSVPAHKSLWSNHDLALQHCRRYEKKEFRTLVETAGLVPVKYTYAVSLAYWPAMLYRRGKRLLPKPNGPPVSDEFPLPRSVNALLYSTMCWEARWLRRHNLAFGLSLMCVAGKPR